MGSAGSASLCVPKENSDRIDLEVASRPSPQGCAQEQNAKDALQLRMENTHLKREIHRMQQELASCRARKQSGERVSCVPLVVNDVVEHLWPFISDYVHNLLKTEVEPSVRDLLPKFAALRFSDSRCSLGVRPPELGLTYVEAHNQTSAAYGTFENVRIVAQLVYDGDCQVEVLALGTAAGVSALKVTGMMVVEFVRLLPRPPFFQGLRMFFMNPPDMEIEMSGTLSKITNMNVLKHGICDIVKNQIAALMVLPNRIVVPLEEDDNIFRLKAPRPEGILRLVVERAEGLVAMDHPLRRRPSSDPYVVVTCGAETWRTSTVPDSLAPSWNHVHDVVVYDRSDQRVRIDVCDEDFGVADIASRILGKLMEAAGPSHQEEAACAEPDKPAPPPVGTNIGGCLWRKDDSLGKARVAVRELLERPGTPTWVQLHDEELGLGEDLGAVQLKAEWRPFVLDQASAANKIRTAWTLEHPTGRSADTNFLLFFGIFGAKGLPWPSREADTHWCDVSVLGRTIDQTRETPHVTAVHPTHRFDISAREDPLAVSAKRETLRQQVDVLSAANVSQDIIAQALSVPESFVAAYLSGSSDVDFTSNAPEPNVVDVVWDEPLMFMLSDAEDVICKVTVRCEDGTASGCAKGSATFIVKSLLEKDTMTNRVESDLESGAKLEVFLQLWVLGEVELERSGGATVGNKQS